MAFSLVPGRHGERPWRELPRWLILWLVLALAAQIVVHRVLPERVDARFKPLPEPLQAQQYQALSLGSGRLMAYLLLLRLQLHDNQKGRHERYERLDYDRLARWLMTLHRMNPRSAYPAFLAARVYSQSKRPEQIRRMIGVIEQFFDEDPQANWRRMTEAVLLAKHPLNDLPLALRLARKLAALPDTVAMPRWARDFEFIVLDELGEKQDALRLVASLLDSGEIRDPDERRFLQDRLLKLQQELSESGQ